MKGWKRSAAALLALLPLLTGCRGPGEYLSYAREMEDMTLIRALGIDLEGEGVLVTASSGLQSGGADREAVPPEVLSARSETVSGAVVAMQSYGTSYVFFGHVGELLLGETMARDGLARALDYVERDVEMRLDVGLFVVRGEAGQAMGALAGEKSSAAERLEALEDDTGLNGATMERSVRQVLADLGASGASFAPAVVLLPQEEGDGAGGEGNLVSAGYAILKEEGLAGWAAGEAALGVNLLLGRVEADILTAGPTGTALRVVEARTGVKPVFDGERLTGLEVDCRVEANVAQAPAGLDAAALETLRTALEETEKRRLEAALELSRTLNADFMGLKKRSGLAAPWHWAKLREQWDDVFEDLDIRVTVEGRIQRGYDLAG